MSHVVTDGSFADAYNSSNCVVEPGLCLLCAQGTDLRKGPSFLWINAKHRLLVSSYKFHVLVINLMFLWKLRRRRLTESAQRIISFSTLQDLECPLLTQECNWFLPIPMFCFCPWAATRVKNYLCEWHAKYLFYASRHRGVCLMSNFWPLDLDATVSTV